MAAAREPQDGDWIELTVVHDSRHVQEIMDLLERARVPARLARLRVEPGTGPASLDGSDALVVEVPAAELPVAAGVVDHFLAEFRQQPEGDARPAEILAALADRDDPEFTAAVAVERARAARQELVRRALALGLIALLLVTTVMAISELFG